MKNLVPQGHKAALVDIEQGARVLRHGEVIGYATAPVGAGK
jgi:hypothetical protein